MAGGVKAVEIQGLRELQRDLREVDARLPRQLRVLNLSVAEDLAVKARARAEAEGGIIAKSAPAIKAGADQRSAWVKLIASDKYPAIFGAEFGAGRTSRRLRHLKSGAVTTYLGFKQFEPWRGNSTDAGYALYPTIRAENDHIVDAYSERLKELLDIAFPD